jgi:hypothetical protein
MPVSLKKKEEKEKRRIVPPIPLFGLSKGGLNFAGGWAAMLESPGFIPAMAVAIGVVVGSIMLWGPSIVDALSGADKGKIKPGWAAWYGDTNPNSKLGTFGAREARKDSLQMAADANKGELGDVYAEGDAEGEGEGTGEEPSIIDDALEEEIVEDDDGVEVRTIPAAGSGGNRPQLVASKSSFFGGKSPAAKFSGGAKKNLTSGSGKGKPPKATTTRALSGTNGRGRGLSSSRRGRGSNSTSAINQLRRTASVSQAGRALGPTSARATEAAAFEGSGGDGASSGGSGVGGGGVNSGTPAATPSSVSTNNSSTTGTTPPPTGTSSNKSPYQDLITMGRLLVGLIDLLLFAAALSSMDKTNPASIARTKALGVGAIMLSLIVAGLGLALWLQFGQHAQGQILVASATTAATLAGLAMWIGKYQPFLFALAGVASGAIALSGMFLGTNRV